MNETPAAAAQIMITIIPIVGIVMGSVLAFFYLLWYHKRSVLLIQSGRWEPVRFNLRAFCLLAGLLLTGVGVVLTLFFALVAGLAYDLLGGLVPLSIGISLLAYHRATRADAAR